METQGNHNPPPHEYQQQIYQEQTKHKKQTQGKCKHKSLPHEYQQQINQGQNKHKKQT